MVLANIACLQTIENDAVAQRALALFTAIANGLDLERMLIYRRAVEAGYFTDWMARESS